MATKPSYIPFYVYLDPYGDKRYLAVKSHADEQGRYIFARPEPIETGHREPFLCTKLGERKWYLEGHDFRKRKDTITELCEVKLSTRKPYYIHSELL